MHLWLDSAARSTTLLDGSGHGFQRKSADLIIHGATASPTSTGVVTHAVGAGLTESFVATQVKLVDLSQSFSGFEGAALRSGRSCRVQDGVTRVPPEWKTAMLVLLVLYPTVMTLSRFLGPVLNDLGACPGG